jgi:hypothetical protein
MTGAQRDFPMHAIDEVSARRKSATLACHEACSSGESAAARIGGRRILIVYLNSFGVQG